MTTTINKRLSLLIIVRLISNPSVSVGHHCSQLEAIEHSYIRTGPPEPTTYSHVTFCLNWPQREQTIKLVVCVCYRIIDAIHALFPFDLISVHLFIGLI